MTLACVTILLLGANVTFGVKVKPGVVRPDNDDCSNFKSVGNVVNLAFDTTLATFDGPGLYMTSPNVWYCYTATCTGSATVSLESSLFDTKLAVYEGCGCYPTSSRFIKGNDDFHGQQSELTFVVKAGNQYLIEVGGYNSTAKGQGYMTITCDNQAVEAANDSCNKAEPVGNVTDLPFDTASATFDGQGHCMTSPNLWYKYTAASTGNVTVSLIGSSFDTKLAIYNGISCPPSSASLIECNDDFESFLQSQITFQATSGHSYLIEVGGYNSDAVGEGILNISSGTAPLPGSKDDCNKAKQIGNVKNLAFDTSDSTFDGPGLCMNSPNIWYCYTAPCTGDVTVSLIGSSYDTMLAVYKGCTCYPTSANLIECNDDFGSAYQSQITFSAIAGNQYLIEVGGYGSATGQGVLTVSCDGGGPTVDTKTDLGDAPDTTNNSGANMYAYYLPWSVPANYPTIYDDGSGLGPYGPLHVNSQLVAYLGTRISGETEADTGPDEDGQNNIEYGTNHANRDGDDDGITVPIPLPNCGWATIDYKVTVVTPGTDLWVNVWIDFNRDGDWDDTEDCPAGPAPEWAVQNQFLFGLPAGPHEITTPAFRSWHPQDGPKSTRLRITLAEQPWTGGSNPGEVGNAGSGPQAKYAIGETEDYFFDPDMTTTDGDCPLCQDVDGNGKIDMQDLTAYVSLWLANCP